MKHYTQDELKAILDAHREWVESGFEGGARADLSRASLSRANLSGAYLSGAYLSGAYLSGAYLSGGIDWQTYLAEVVPALLAAGGKALDVVLDSGCFECHAWENCPMHEAFNAPNLSAIPALYRGEAARFIELFDAKAITVKAIREAAEAR